MFVDKIKARRRQCMVFTGRRNWRGGKLEAEGEKTNSSWIPITYQALFQALGILSGEKNPQKTAIVLYP